MLVCFRMAVISITDGLNIASSPPLHRLSTVLVLRLRVKGGTYPRRDLALQYQTTGVYSASICVHDDISTWCVASVHMYSTVSITGILHLGLVSDIYM